MRARSKALLGGWYRAEVAEAIGALGAATWTLDDLAAQLPEVPRSCVNKEVNILLECDFVLRNAKNERGQYVYSTAGLSEYWSLGRALVGAGDRSTSVVVPLRSIKRGAPRA